MARDGLAYEEVARVASMLRAQGAKISNRTVLAETGGSASTVHQHLKRWHAENPEPGTTPPELPVAIQRALQEELRRIQAEARAELEGRLANSQQEAEDLARESERLQDENEAMQQQLVSLTAERDRLQGQARQQAADIERGQQQLEQERRAAEAARVDLAQARLKVESQGELVEQMRSELKALRTSIDTERAGRIETERSLASATASLQELRKNLDQMIALHDEVDGERNELQKALNEERAKTAEAQRELASCRAENKAAGARAEDLARREKALQEELQQLRSLRERKPSKGGSDED